MHLPSDHTTAGRFSTVTIVMYHYVRELSRSRYPGIKGLELRLFREQLAYIQRYYVVVTAQELLHAVKEHATDGRWDLPANACLLTFDDGYTEHFRHVFPLLDEAGIQGSFFPPVGAVIDRKVLDVNKVHFVLASVPDVQTVLGDTFTMIGARREEFGLPSDDALRERLARPSRYDGANVVLLKKLLQEALPSPVRAEIVDALFRKYVTQDEVAFASELYVSLDELRCMHRNGMYVGNHTSTHPWLGLAEPERQVEEIDRALDMLRDVGTDLDGWIMCYPYGSSSAGLLDVLRDRQCRVGLTTRVDIASAAENPLLLSRLDTTDLPTDSAASVNDWTRRIR